MEQRPFIIDCDTGTDDAIALMAAFGCEEIDVKAITSVNGNVAERYTSANNLNLAEYLGKDVEVAHGATYPLYLRERYNSGTHGSTGLGDVVLPEAQTMTFSRDYAPEVIRRIAAQEGGRLELLVVGPMTNIAIALSMYPELREQIRHIWCMGGAIRGGNVNTNAEFNVWVDPVAAHLVMTSGIPMTLVGLDVTERAVMQPEDEVRLRALGTRASVLTADLLKFMFERCAKGGEDALMHDSLAVAAAVKPECLVCEPYYVDTVWSGEYTAGHTAVDVYRKTGKASNMQVAVDIDVEMFRAWLCECVGRC